MSEGSRALGVLFECEDTGPCKGDLQLKEQALSSLLRSESHESEGQGRRQVKTQEQQVQIPRELENDGDPEMLRCR